MRTLRKIAGAIASPENNEFTGIAGLVQNDTDMHAHERAAGDRVHGPGLKALEAMKDNLSSFRDSPTQRWPKEARVISAFEQAFLKQAALAMGAPKKLGVAQKAKLRMANTQGA